MPHQLSQRDLIDWASETTPTFRVRTSVDALPGGYSAAMAPLLVNWQKSNYKDHTGDDEYYLVRNVNCNGNPVEGITNLCTMRVPACGVESAEFVRVPLGPASVQIGGHGMIRIIFKSGAEPQLLTPYGEPVDGEATVKDLVISCEAWRPPGARFDMQEALDANTFGLTYRCYTGPQRFLEDALHKRDWTSYPLALPSGQRGLDELLYVAMVMGDSLARHTIARLFEIAERKDADESAAGETPEDYPNPKKDEWHKLRAALDENRAPEDPITDIMGGKISYQLLERSCITMALEIVAITAQRLTASLPEDERIHARVTPEHIPSWIEDLAHASRAGIFVRLPHALWWLINNSNVLPSRAWHNLDDAGLLLRDANGPVTHEYNLHGETPYGKLSNNLLV